MEEEMTVLMTATDGEHTVERELSTMGTAVMASKMYPGWDVHLHHVFKAAPIIVNAELPLIDHSEAVEGLVDTIEALAGVQVEFKDPGSKPWSKEHAVQILGSIGGSFDAHEASTIEIEQMSEEPSFKPTQDVIEEMTDAIEAGQYEIVNPGSDVLDELGIVDLRKLAKPYKIPGAWSMKSAELREAIRAAREQ
jgi:predicted peroxiredoxin